MEEISDGKKEEGGKAQQKEMRNPELRDFLSPCGQD